MKLYPNRFSKLTLLCVFVICFMMLMQQSCRKSETSIQPQTEIDPAIKFFNLQGNVHPSVKKVADKINRQNQEKHFLNQFVKAQGYALWDKAIVKSVQKNTQSTRNSANKQNGNNDLILIPLVLKDSSQVHGALSCIVDGDSISIKLIDGSKYNWYNAHPDSLGMTGEQVTLLLMQLDKSVFNHKTFKITDSTAFGKLVGRYSKYIKIVDSLPNKFKPATAARWEYYSTEVYYTTDEPDMCGCDPAYPCPGGGTHEVYHSVGVSGFMWVEDAPWYDPNAGWNGNGGYNNGYGGGNGDYSGGGGNGGGNNNGLPVEPDLGDPMISTYHLSANDTRVINQLDAEDAASNNILANLDCQGTKSSGNISFNGTIEHWIIQLDYIAKHPIGGEREYAIPQSSATVPGNRGRADLVNTVTREIFEIKSVAQLNAGIDEVANYVFYAKKNCPVSPGPLPPVNQWHEGTNYIITRLPSGDPTKNILAKLAANGVITYEDEPKNINPDPLPLVIPSSVLDKLKSLVDRLKNNITDADRIIAQYLNQNPELLNYIKGAAIGAAVGIVVGTIIEDFATVGAGILDDFASFTLAYRIVRFAWAL